MPPQVENSRVLTLPEHGPRMQRFIAELYPICRSITGNGVRQTLSMLERRIPIKVQEVLTGTKVFDWTVPREWNIRAAHIKDPLGNTIVDFRDCNLHVVNYSAAFSGRVSLAELKQHVHTLPDRPDWVPYRTSYYNDNWGFCLSHRQLQSLPEGEYEVLIDSSLEPGHLTFGEFYLPGETSDEVLFSCHICHPSLCNDNLSGIAVATELAELLVQMPRRFSYRFLFIPGTIGSITWLALNEGHTSRIKAGLVLTGLGDRGPLTYKKSRRGNTEIDQVLAHVLKASGMPYEIREFSPYGYDERQFCSPGFNLPVGRLGRTPHNEYPEYHTSADNLDFVHPESLAGSLQTLLTVINVIENNRTFINRSPKCEPQLGKRGLYRAIGGESSRTTEMAMLWVLNLSDGNHNLLNIAERSGLPFADILDVANLLRKHALLSSDEGERSATAI